MANPAGQSSAFVALDIVPITPSDTVDLDVVPRELRASGSGTLRVTTFAGAVRNTRIVADVPLPLAVRRVHATGTTATGIEGLI